MDALLFWLLVVPTKRKHKVYRIGTYILARSFVYLSAYNSQDILCPDLTIRDQGGAGRERVGHRLTKWDC